MAFIVNKKAFCVLEFAKNESIVTSAASPRVHISSTCKVRQKLGVSLSLSLSVDMLLSAVSVLVVAQSSSEIPEGLMNNPIYIYIYIYMCVCMCVCVNNSSKLCRLVFDVCKYADKSL